MTVSETEARKIEVTKQFEIHDGLVFKFSVTFW